MSEVKGGEVCKKNTMLHVVGQPTSRDDQESLHERTMKRQDSGYTPTMQANHYICQFHINVYRSDNVTVHMCLHDKTIGTGKCYIRYTAI